MDMNLQLFGGRGVSSSNASKKAKASTSSSQYDNENVDDYGNWWEDNLDYLADKFEEKYKKPPVNPKTGTTNSKWDDFTRSEWKKTKQEAIKTIKQLIDVQKQGKGRKNYPSLETLEKKLKQLQK